MIDVGAGKGYLSTFLSAEFGLEVTAIDCVKNNLEKTLERAKSLEKHFHHRSNQADEKMEKKSTKIKIECVGDVVRKMGLDSCIYTLLDFWSSDVFLIFDFRQVFCKFFDFRPL